MTNKDINAFVIGNGVSRQGFDLLQLKPYGTVYGCNALYRDYAPNYELPDYLVSIDPPIIEEIQNSDFPQDRFIIPPEDEQREPKECNLSRPRSNAGVNAVLESIKHGKKRIFCLGFDFLIANKRLSTSNIYDESPCYEPSTRASYFDNLNRTKYLDYVCSKNIRVKFYMVYPRGEFTVHNVKAPNILGIFYETLHQYI